MFEMQGGRALSCMQPVGVLWEKRTKKSKSFVANIKG
jgi:hypothetical protein